MEFILKNYMIIIIVGLFFVFALIGYLIDMLRKNNNYTKNESSDTIKPIEIAKIETENNIETEKNLTDNKQNRNKENEADELLINYDNESKE